MDSTGGTRGQVTVTTDTRWDAPNSPQQVTLPRLSLWTKVGAVWGVGIKWSCVAPTPGRHPEVHCWTQSGNRGARAKGRVRQHKGKRKDEKQRPSLGEGPGENRRTQNGGRGGGGEAAGNVGPAWEPRHLANRN